MSNDIPPPEGGPGRASTRLRAALSTSEFGQELLAFLESEADVEPTPATIPELPETESAIIAAINHTFTLDSSKGSPAREPASFGEVAPAGQAETNAILANAASIMIAGRRRLCLDPRARADLLRRVLDSERYRTLLDRAAQVDQEDLKLIPKDLVRLPSAWLRSFLRNTSGNLEQAPVPQLRAAVQALEQLQYLEVGSIKLPSLAEARRRLVLGELLDPLRILIGTTGGWDGTSQQDRFVGRKQEIAMLRRFVDELKSETRSEAAGRFFNRFYKGVQYLFGIRDESVMFVQAQGGLGKSTLMAKFMIDHARNRSNPFPFVYLDFDRADLHPREPLQLLMEAARQVALQFPDVQSEITALRERLRAELAGRTTTAARNSYDDFRNLIRSRITQRKRAFLLVLDTMEVVQFDPKSLAGVINFVSELSGRRGEAEFPELKIVAAGRADVPDLRTEPDKRSEDRHLILQPLPVEDAREMAARVGHDLLGTEWRSEWAGLIAGRESDAPDRREPLAVRVAIELIRAAQPDVRQKLVEDIAREGAAADQSFIGRLYERRVISHVQNPLAQKLAWPGLVVRRVTRDIIRRKLAALCGINPDDTDEVFTALANEVWMVEELDGGGTLRHRPDLRSRTLPLMRLRNPELFAKVNDAARDYFEERSNTPEGRAEWLYHRLLAGEDPEQVDRDWTDDMFRLLAGAHEDFPREAPERFSGKTTARDYLLARTADRVLPREVIQRLSPRLALDHLARAGAHLGSFDDMQIEPILADLSDRIGRDVSTSQPHPVGAIICVKTGRWNVDTSFEGGEGAWAVHADFARRFWRAREFAPNPQLERTPPDLPIRTIIQDLAAARVLRSDSAFDNDDLLAKLLEQPRISAQPSDVAALRTAVVFGRHSSANAARVWLRIQESQSRQRMTALSLAELAAFANTGKAILAEAELPAALERIGIQWPLLAKLAEEHQRYPMRLADRNVADAVLRLIARMLDDPPQHMRTIRRFFAARDEDWIIPFGYAAARACSWGGLPPTVFARLSSHEPSRSNFPGLDASTKSDEPPSDPIRIMRRADEASDLLETARTILGAGSTSASSEDLRALLRCYTEWRRRIEQVIDETELPV